MSDEAEQRYEQAADGALRKLERALEAVDAPFEADLESGILTLEFSDGAKYVINSHRAARQIWMAAEREAWHFDHDPAADRWVASRSGDELWSALSRLLSKKLGVIVELPR